MGRITQEERYKQRYMDIIRKQRKALEDFMALEVEFADDLMTRYRLRGEDMPDDEYRACAYFINQEFAHRPGSLTLLYEVFLRCFRELPEPTQETAFNMLASRFRMYAVTLEKGGYNGPKNW